MNVIYSKPGTAPYLHTYGEVIVAHLDLTPGHWAIFGKVYIYNRDSDDQDATVNLRTYAGTNYGPYFIDHSEARMLGGGALEIGVQGVYETQKYVQQSPTYNVPPGGKILQSS